MATKSLKPGSQYDVQTIALHHPEVMQCKQCMYRNWVYPCVSWLSPPLHNTTSLVFNCKPGLKIWGSFASCTCVSTNSHLVGVSKVDKLSVDKPELSHSSASFHLQHRQLETHMAHDSKAHSLLILLLHLPHLFSPQIAHSYQAVAWSSQHVTSHWCSPNVKWSDKKCYVCTITSSWQQHTLCTLKSTSVFCFNCCPSWK